MLNCRGNASGVGEVGESVREVQGRSVGRAKRERAEAKVSIVRDANIINITKGSQDLHTSASQTKPTTPALHSTTASRDKALATRWSPACLQQVTRDAPGAWHDRATRVRSPPPPRLFFN